MLPLYARVLSNASSITWKGVNRVQIASPESLILTKMIAFHPRDRDDIETLLASNRDTIKVAIIRQEWSAIADDDDARMAWLEDAIQRLVPHPE